MQDEPSDSLDPTRLGFFAAIGIQKGKPFAPDARMKTILTEAAAVGDATARAITFRIREKADYYYSNSAWRLPFVGGYKFEEPPGVLNLDGYVMFYFLATGVTPAMEQKMVGLGSQYAWAAADAGGWMAEKIMGCVCRPMSRSKISGRSFFTATRHARCCRLIKNTRPSAARRRDC